MRCSWLPIFFRMDFRLTIAKIKFTRVVLAWVEQELLNTLGTVLKPPLSEQRETQSRAKGLS